MTEDQYTDSADVSQLEQRIDELEETIRQMLPSRREAIGMGVAGLAGASLMSGTASAGSSQVGTIGDANNLVDVQAEDIDVSDTITTQDLIVNGTATGSFGGGGAPVLESGDTITVETFARSTTDQAFVTLYNGSAKDVLGGIIASERNCDFLYTFSDSTTLRKNGSGTSYTQGNASSVLRGGGGQIEIDFLPPAKDVTKIEVGASVGGTELGAEVILKG